MRVGIRETPQELPEWEIEADRVCAAMVKRAPDVVRKASEALYEQMLFDVQDYLRDNVHYNLSSELATAKHRAQAAERQIEAISAAIGSTRFMDPPDGGDVSLADQVRRMRAELEAKEARLAALENQKAGFADANSKSPIQAREE